MGLLLLVGIPILLWNLLKYWAKKTGEALQKESDEYWRKDGPNYKAYWKFVRKKRREEQKEEQAKHKKCTKNYCWIEHDMKPPCPKVIR